MKIEYIDERDDFFSLQSQDWQNDLPGELNFHKASKEMRKNQ